MAQPRRRASASVYPSVLVRHSGDYGAGWPNAGCFNTGPHTRQTFHSSAPNTAVPANETTYGGHTNSGTGQLITAKTQYTNITKCNTAKAMGAVNSTNWLPLDHFSARDSLASR